MPLAPCLSCQARGRSGGSRARTRRCVPRRGAQDVRALAITGPAGIGKTAIWQRGAPARRGARVVVLLARPSGGEVRLAFAALADLLGARRRRRRLHALPRPQRRALEVALLRAESATRALDSRAVAAGLLSLLRELAVVGAAPARGRRRAVARRGLRGCARVRGAAARQACPVGVLVSVRVGDGPTRELRASAPDERGGSELEIAGSASLRCTRCSSEQLGRAFPRPDARQDRGRERRKSLLRPRDRAASSTGRAFQPPGRRCRCRRKCESLARRGCERLPDRDARGAPRGGEPVPAATSRSSTRRLWRRRRRSGLVTVAATGRPTSAIRSSRRPSTSRRRRRRRRRVHRALAERVADPEEHARHLALAATGPDEQTAQALDRAAELVAGRGAVGDRRRAEGPRRCG